MNNARPMALVLLATAALALIAAAPAKPPPRLLSLLRTTAPGQCSWMALSAPDGEPETLATFPNACAGATVSVAHAGALALVQFRADAAEATFGAAGYPKPAFPAPPPEAAGARAELWLVDLTANTHHQLPPLPEGRVVRTGFDSDGKVVALALVELPTDLKISHEPDINGDQTLHFKWHDRPYEMPASEGLVAMALAYRLDSSDAWTMVEDKPTTIGWDYALGVDALDATKLWSGRTDAVEEDWESLEVLPRTQATLRESLKGFAPAVDKDSNDGFTRLRPRAPGRGEFLVWQVATEFAHDTGLVLFHAPGAKSFTIIPGLGYTAGDLARISFQGDLGLVTTEGLFAHPRLLDLKTGRIVFRSDQDFGVGFWKQDSM